MFIAPSIEHEFRRVESVLIHAARNPDEPVCVPAQLNLSPRTLANNIRSGANAWLHHRFDSELSDLQFETFWPTRQTCIIKGDVIIRAKGSHKGPVAEFRTNNNKGIIHMTITCHELEVINAVALLYKEGILTEAVHFPSLQEAESVQVQEMIDNAGGYAILTKQAGYPGFVMLPDSPPVSFDSNGEDTFTIIKLR